MRDVWRGPERMVRRQSVRGEGGQAMVEFAAVIIPFFLLLMGIFDLGRGILNSNMISNAAREAARAGIVLSSTGTPDSAWLCDTAMRAVWQPGVPPPVLPACGALGAMTAQVLDRGTRGDPADPVRVRVTYDFKPFVPLLSTILTLNADCDCIKLSATASMYVES